MDTRRLASPRIYHVAPRVIAAQARQEGRSFAAAWQQAARHAAALGFDRLLCGMDWHDSGHSPHLIEDPYTPHSGAGLQDPYSKVLADMADSCREQGLGLWVDFSLAAALVDGPLAKAHPEWYGVARGRAAGPDPRVARQARRTAHVQLSSGTPAPGFLTFWRDHLLHLAGAGVEGVRVYQPQCLPASAWRQLVDSVRESASDFCFTAWTPGLSVQDVAGLADAGFDAVYSSLPWWNLRDTWYVEEHERLHTVAKVIAPVGAWHESDLPAPGRDGLLRLMACAAELGEGLLVPMHVDLTSRGDPATGTAMARLNAKMARQPDALHTLRQLAGPPNPFTLILRRAADLSSLVLINPASDEPAALDWTLISARTAAGVPRNARQRLTELAPSEVLALALTAGKPVQTQRRRTSASGQRVALDEAMQAPRIIIQDVTPSLAVRSQLIKRCVGETLTVRANIFMDGHDVLAARVLWRAVDEKEWTAVDMAPLGNDAWEASFFPEREGRHEYTIEAWRDVYGTYHNELSKKHRAGLDVSLEVEEGRQLLASAGLSQLAGTLDVQGLLAPSTVEAMKSAAPREFSVRMEPAQALSVERRAASFASWYELFPRSQSGDTERHGTFDDVIARLPYVRDMGFDVLYFPPIHPIGLRNRKGRNNSLVAKPGDPGSPYAIGSAEGGHDAIHPELGTLEDFRRLIKAAAEHGLEIALDFAIQCSPDHPWLRDHPDWFAWRADGSLRYAENPPKKYEDIVNVDFYGKPGKHGKHAGAAGLWRALRDVVLFWADEGVRTFRVDNPHTKPLPFWEWLIADVQSRYPDTLFLSEAFTRPNMMYHLARIGFSQSYTYFTWRNTGPEMAAYLTEIGNAPVADFFRPNFFVNTPDINPHFLQQSGRAGFLIRAALATTLSGLWGMYSGFELCEAAPVPGKEEYLDSEKYEIRAWDWDRPGNIRAEITQLNHIRRANPALHSHRGIEFLPSSNPNVLFFCKATPQRDNVLLIAICMDPHRPQESVVELPLWQFDRPDHGELPMQDLLHDRSFTWHGKRQVLRLHPDAPYGIWRVDGLA